MISFMKHNVNWQNLSNNSLVTINKPVNIDDDHVTDLKFIQSFQFDQRNFRMIALIAILAKIKIK